LAGYHLRLTHATASLGAESNNALLSPRADTHADPCVFSIEGGPDRRGPAEPAARASELIQLKAEALATVRFETPPGKQLQIDFGERRVTIGDEKVKVYLFVATLGCSRGGFMSGRFATSARRVGLPVSSAPSGTLAGLPKRCCSQSR